MNIDTSLLQTKSPETGESGAGIINQDFELDGQSTQDSTKSYSPSTPHIKPMPDPDWELSPLFLPPSVIDATVESSSGSLIQEAETGETGSLLQISEEEKTNKLSSQSASSKTYEVPLEERKIRCSIKQHIKHYITNKAK